MPPTFYFAYGTLKRGFPNFEAYKKYLEWVGPYQTVEKYPLVVTKHAECTNPGCKYNHRRATLVEKKGAGEYVKGDLFEVQADGFVAIDLLEGLGSARPSYSRKAIRLRSTQYAEKEIEAQTYFATDADNRIALVEKGVAEMVEEFTLEMARPTLKTCCRRTPRHEGPHSESTKM